MAGVLILLLLNIWLSKGAEVPQNYREDLMLKHLPDGRVLGHFEHRTTWNVDPVLLAAPNQGKNILIHFVHSRSQISFNSSSLWIISSIIGTTCRTLRYSRTPSYSH